MCRRKNSCLIVIFFVLFWYVVRTVFAYLCANVQKMLLSANFLEEKVRVLRENG